MSESEGKGVAYYRVSSEKKQGRDGNGMAAQRIAVESYARETGCQIIAEYVETETGTDKQDRPVLERAIAHCRFAKARLVVGKQDRLSRDVHYLTGLMKSGIDFIACDDRTTNPTWIQMKVVWAEAEAKLISQRTRDSLSAFKASRRISKRILAMYPDGVPLDVVEAVAGKLGASLPQCRNLTPEASQKGARRAGETHAREAAEFNGFIAPRIIELRRGGMTLQQVADTLNSESIQTRRGKDWTHVQIRNILARYGG
jgi:DNA invertase Pin-like site-specific DNA recombinase